MKVKLSLAVGLLLCFAAVGRADTIYTYTGNAFDTFSGQSSCSCSLSGWIDLAQPLTGSVTSVTPVAFSFTAEGHTITNLNAVITTFNLAGSANGVTLWTIDLTSGNLEFWSQFAGSGAEATDFATIGGAGASEEGHRGSWSAAVATPEPATLLLLGIAAPLALRRRKR